MEALNAKILNKASSLWSHTIKMDENGAQEYHMDFHAQFKSI